MDWVLLLWWCIEENVAEMWSRNKGWVRSTFGDQVEASDYSSGEVCPVTLRVSEKRMSRSDEECQGGRGKHLLVENFEAKAEWHRICRTRTEVFLICPQKGDNFCSCNTFEDSKRQSWNVAKVQCTENISRAFSSTVVERFHSTKPPENDGFVTLYWTAVLREMNDTIPSHHNSII